MLRPEFAALAPELAARPLRGRSIAVAITGGSAGVIPVSQLGRIEATDPDPASRRHTITLENRRESR